MREQLKFKIRWQNRVEKYASEQDRAQQQPQEIIDWETEDEVSLDDALALGFRIKQKEVQHGNGPSR